MPLKFSEFPEDLPLEAATLGQHNGDILREWLGRSDKEIEELRAAKVLHEGDVVSRSYPARCASLYY